MSHTLQRLYFIYTSSELSAGVGRIGLYHYRSRMICIVYICTLMLKNEQASQFNIVIQHCKNLLAVFKDPMLPDT